MTNFYIIEMLKVLKCKSNVHKNVRLLLLFVIIIKYKCTVATLFTRLRFSYSEMHSRYSIH